MLLQDPPAKDPPAKDPLARDPPATDPLARDPLAKDPPATDPTAKDPAKGPAKEERQRKGICSQLILHQVLCKINIQCHLPPDLYRPCTCSTATQHGAKGEIVSTVQVRE